MSASATRRRDYDVAIIGAGFSGLYMLHLLRQRGWSVVVFEKGPDVGGTWFWNRYPGARCDIPTTDYAYSFDPLLEEEWTWTEKYATQPEILAYLNHVADRFDLRPDIEFSTCLTAANWSESEQRWHLLSDGGAEIACRFFVMAGGCLSVPKAPDLEGLERFAGEVHQTALWPQDPVDVEGKRVAVIGTGSSAIQCIPHLAEKAAHLTVFQRTPNFSIPAHNGPASAERLAALKADRAAYREAARTSRGGIPSELTTIFGRSASDEVRRERFEAAWEAGELFAILGVFADQGFNRESNELVAEMIRQKIRDVVDDPQTAEDLCPYEYPFGTKRPCLDTNYFDTFNRSNVRLVNLKRQPFKTITEKGLETVDEPFDFDVLVLATGFDAMTGAIHGIDIVGRDGVTLKDKWSQGPATYLGLTTLGFPNFFMITGPGSPSVLSNMLVSIEQHVEWIGECLDFLRREGFETIEPTPTAENGWKQHVEDCAAITLHPQADSWYMGANVPGKPRVLLPYIGGVDAYRAACDEVVARNYLGFELTKNGGAHCHDGVVRRLQPDVTIVLNMMADLQMPPVESVGVEGARAMMKMTAAAQPPGPDVGEVCDGTFPGVDGDIGYRLYRPPAHGPLPVLLYFHGGGWTIGDLTTDDALCRDLCVQAGCIVISIEYRLAPESPFPAAVHDAEAALEWVAQNMDQLGGRPGSLAVGGWSSGANLAAVLCQRARDSGGPALAGQMLLSPVTDCDLDRPSYRRAGEGYVLTTSLVKWFWDNYAPPDQRTSPLASPLRGDLVGLPPAVVVTAEFDPLRDEGTAYAEALEAAGVPVQHLDARGHIHTSIPMVDLIVSGAPLRREMARGLRAFFDAPPEPGAHLRSGVGGARLQNGTGSR